MKVFVKYLMALGCVLLLTSSAVGCSSASDSEPQQEDLTSVAPPLVPTKPANPGNPGNPGNTANAAAEDKLASNGNTKDGIATAIGAALDGDANWQGSILHVKLKNEAISALGGLTECRVIREFLVEDQSATLDMNGTVISCTELLAEMED